MIYFNHFTIRSTYLNSPRMISILSSGSAPHHFLYEDTVGQRKQAHADCYYDSSHRAFLVIFWYVVFYMAFPDNNSRLLIENFYILECRVHFWREYRDVWPAPAVNEMHIRHWCASFFGTYCCYHPVQSYSKTPGSFKGDMNHSIRYTGEDDEH